ncbi:MAG: protein kinase [Gemmataceae bacterium]|nr:protein kinase [Gemmataceae bacterium]
MDTRLTCQLPSSSSGVLALPFRPDPVAQVVLQDLLESSLVLPEDWEALADEARKHLAACRRTEELLPRLVEYGLITEYQERRIGAGTTFGLILGNYRVLARLGAGGMGVVFRAEHMRMRKQVAIKVLPLSSDQDQRILRRFLTEIRAIAQLQHPNIVGAIDAGELASEGPSLPVLHFFVMEYVPGQDLEEYVRDNGPLSPHKAADIGHQIASALAEAHKHNLVHRDIKPSNIQLTPEGQAKLLDFGLARHYQASHFRTGVTEPGTVLGTLDYMAPEQVEDAHQVDIRADLYALGGTLYWCLTGDPPFPPRGSLVEQLAARLSQQPPSMRARRPDLSRELDGVVQRLMALSPNDRFQNPAAVMRALLPFLKPDLRDHSRADEARPSLHGVRIHAEPGPTDQTGPQPSFHRVLLVDDENEIRVFCRYILQTEGLVCDEASGGPTALKMAYEKPYDLLVLDINMQDMQGTEVCRRLRANPPSPHLKVIMASGHANSDTMAQMLLGGADDFVTKPFSTAQLKARVKAALRLKDAQDRTDVLHTHLLAVNRELEASLGARDTDLVQVRNALVLALARLVEQRDTETGAHLTRMQRYCRALAEEAARSGFFSAQVDAPFIEMLECCVPLHDIGKVGLPDHILLKPGKLDTEERVLMQAHTLIGAEPLQEVAKQHGEAVAFLQMAIDIVRHHHERYDGKGYPDRLAGSDIPLAARMVAIADVYDALRSRRPYKPALSHSAALQVMLESSAGQFDLALMQIFQRCAAQFDRIYRETPD